MKEDLLTEQDLVELAKNPSVSAKASTAKKVTSLYNGKNITDKGIKLAEDIFRIMVEDVEIKVREALSESLRNSQNIPKDIARKIIKDKASVSVPFIKYYAHLNNDDLISILDTQTPDKQKAVAQRKHLSDTVSHHIADKCNEDIVGTLIANDSAKIKEKTYNIIVDKYKQNDIIKKGIVYRSEIPVSVAEKIVTYLSDDLQKDLVIKHNLPANLVSDIIEQVKEKATLQISADYSSDKQVENLVGQLHSSGKLTSSLIVRAICMGDLKFFEYAIVKLSNSPMSEVRKTLFNLNIDFMIRNLLRKAYIDKSMFPAVFSALKVIKDIKFDSRYHDRKSFMHKVIARILSYENASEELSDEDIKYLISKIS